MSYSHKPRPGFALHSIPRPEHRRFRAALLRCAALVSVLLLAASGAPLIARAADPVPESQVAPSAPSDALPEVASSETAAPVPASVTYPARERRRTPRPAAEIKSEAPRVAPAPPRTIGDINGWLDYKARAHVLALPLEARLFYRRGVLADRSGKRDEAERWVRAAAELDPTFVDPHLTIAAWSLPGRPSQALVHWAAVLDLTRESFMIQAGLAANAVFVTFQSLLAALLIAGLIIVTLRLPELSHPWAERLGVLLRPETARWW